LASLLTHVLLFRTPSVQFGETDGSGSEKRFEQVLRLMWPRAEVKEASVLKLLGPLLSLSLTLTTEILK
jgi:hypothetical protein